MSEHDTPPRGLGYREEPFDRRDFRLFKAPPSVVMLPQSATHLGNMETLGEPMDQGMTNSCVGHAVASTVRNVMVRAGLRRPFMTSPVATYLWARELGGNREEDSGCYIRDGYKALQQRGAVPMSNLKPRFAPRDLAGDDGLFPKTSIWRRPVAPGNLADGLRRQVTEYLRCGTLAEALTSIASGYVVTLGFMVHRSFYDWAWNANSVIPMPAEGERQLGGHAVAPFDYDMPSRLVACWNSYGATAHNGKPYFYLPFEYIERWAWDMWTPRIIEGGRV